MRISIKINLNNIYKKIGIFMNRTMKNLKEEIFKNNYWNVCDSNYENSNSNNNSLYEP